MKTLNFTVALIARNEEKTLPRLLDSLKEFQERGGEIVLLDTGSTDNTASYARSRGVKVTEVGDTYRRTIDVDMARAINARFIRNDEGDIVKEGDTLFDFAAARNYAASLASNDMIAMPDCDEVYTKLDIDKVIEAIENGASQLEYNFVYSHDNEGNEMIKFMHSKFYDRTKLSWVGIIHEVLNGDANRMFLDESIIKLEHWQNEETNRGGYLRGLALDCFNNPGNDRNSHYLARELFYHNKLNSAIAEFERHLTLGGWSTERSESMNYIALSLLRLGRREEALGWFARAFDMEPRRREPLMYMADMYYQSGNADHALAYASAAIQIKEEANFYANYRPFYEHYPHEILYWALWQKDEYHASKTHFDICLALQPYSSKYLHDLRYYTILPKISFVIPTLGRPEGLKRCVDSIKNLNYPQDKIQIIVMGSNLNDPENTEDIVRDPSPDFNQQYPDIMVLYAPYGKGTVPQKMKSLVHEAHGDWIVYASNDIEFTPDSLIIALKTANDNAKNFMAFNTGDFGPEKGNQCEHFMIHRKLLPKIGGEIFDTEFTHVGVDALLWAQMEKLGQAMRCMRAIVHHYHFSRPGGGEPDEVNKLVWKDEIVQKDRDLLAKKLQALNEIVYGEKFNG